MPTNSVSRCVPKRRAAGSSKSPIPCSSPSNRITTSSASPQWLGQVDGGVSANASPNAQPQTPSVARFGSCGSVAEKTDMDTSMAAAEEATEEPYATIVKLLSDALSEAKNALVLSQPQEIGKMQARIIALERANEVQAQEIATLKKQNATLKQMMRSGSSGSPVKFRTLEEARAARRAVSFLVPASTSRDEPRPSASVISTVPAKMHRGDAPPNSLTPLEQARAIRRSMRTD
eukprot:GILI01040298.1.p1 GENE.GILI01040298.1~~GILI01040298.1.p1  ORF type:complete len:233 (+),score=24.98 GILI01040298.1:29-727(+)